MDRTLFFSEFPNRSTCHLPHHLMIRGDIRLIRNSCDLSTYPGCFLNLDSDELIEEVVVMLSGYLTHRYPDDKTG
jgi:hypothetical protein